MLTFASLGRYGRYANQLFQVAGTIGLATKYGYSFAFPQWKNYDHAERFGSSEDIDLQKYFVNPLPTVDPASFPDYPVSWGWHPDLHPPDNVSLSGHFQSEKYFKHCIEVVRHYFRMKGELKLPGAVAIHVRWGDYDNHYHPRLGRDYYERAMAHFPRETCFKVFSDEPQKALEMLCSFGFDYVYLSEGNSYIEDFRLMKGCGHFITGNSSFSLMAAILSDAPDKKIVCPSTWWGPGWCPNHKELCKDIYPENAIVI